MNATEESIGYNREYRVPFAALFCVCLLLLPSVPASSQTPLLDDWYRDSRGARRYEDHRSEFADVLERARADGVPPELIMLVLQEGAAKQVSPARLIEAMWAEESRLATSRSILEAVDLLPLRTEDIRNALRQLSVSQAAGVTPASIEQILSKADDTETGLAAVSAVAQVMAIQPVDPETATGLGVSMLASQLAAATYPSLSSAFLRGTIQGLPPESVARIIVDVLDAGGGLIQIDRELRARGRRR